MAKTGSRARLIIVLAALGWLVVIPGRTALTARVMASHASVVCDPSTGHCYEYVAGPLNWDNAKAAAEAMEHNGVSGHLATLTSQDEINFIVANLPDAVFHHPPFDGGAYIGAFQLPGSIEAHGGWQWVTGEPWDFTNWAGGEPNNAGNEDVANFWNGAGAWNDVDRDLEKGYLVEYPAPPADSDGDGVPDSEDAFPGDPAETADSDGDGAGDNGDAFPNDPAETADSDGDGVGDNGDAFPNDPAESADSDGDGVGNNGDAFPNNPAESADSDGDGVGNNGDAFPNSNRAATVSVGACSTGVANRLLSNGATFNDLIGQAFAAAGGNHGAWVSAVSALSNGWKSAGLISGQEHGKIVSCVAKQNGKGQ